MTAMFKQVNKKKEFAPNEIDEIDEALSNLLPFAEYKEQSIK